jgi:adenylosuccinate synthase
MDVTVLFGGQFGSEGKGLIASYLAGREHFNLATTDAGPNAGHTAIYNGNPLITFHLPMVGVLTPGCVLWLNGGAIINPDILIKEIETMETVHGIEIKSRLLIHPDAAVIEPCDLVEEIESLGPMARISSTQKGVGAAARRRMGRGAHVAKDFKELKRFCAVVTPQRWPRVVVEVAQGYSLSINSGFYPYTTFRCCSPAQGLMNASIPTTAPHKVWAVLRVNPIRVGSLPGGHSGDVFPDQHETTWEALGQAPQYTTVTNRLRRVFSYSRMQVDKMIRETAPTHILINFAQTQTPGWLDITTQYIYQTYRDYGLPTPEIYYGYGPAPADISENIRT